MTTPAAGAITHVSDTAHWVAIYRALESERPDAHFHDPYARRLGGVRGEAIVRAMPRGMTMSWPLVVRTCVMDEILMRTLAEGDVDVVLNLACGLDARPWRLPLPASLHWVEVDLPAMIAFKRAELANERPACMLESVALDLANREARRELFARVAGMGKRVFVISEGLLIYLAPEDVASLADDLRAPPSFVRWMFDLASPALLEWMAKGWGKRVAEGGAPFRFAPAENTQFFAPHGWSELEYRSTWEEAKRLKRTPALSWLWTFMGMFAPPARRAAFRRFSGVVVLERGSTGS